MTQPIVDAGKENALARKPRQSTRRQNPLAEMSDHALVERARGGDERAFEALMRRYNRRLFRVARSVLRDTAAAEDAVQEAYIRAFTHLHRYEPTGSFGGWLTRIALNQALMLRRRCRNDTISLDQMTAAAYCDEHMKLAEPAAAPDSMDALHARQLLEQAVDALPEAFRIVFVLRAVEQLSIAETAACLALNESTVKTRLHRAQRRLRTDLSRRLQREQLSIFEFDGPRCDRIVAAVFAHLRKLAARAEAP